MVIWNRHQPHWIRLTELITECLRDTEKHSLILSTAKSCSQNLQEDDSFYAFFQFTSHLPPGSNNLFRSDICFSPSDSPTPIHTQTIIHDSNPGWKKDETEPFGCWIFICQTIYKWGSSFQCVLGSTHEWIRKDASRIVKVKLWKPEAINVFSNDSSNFGYSRFRKLRFSCLPEWRIQRQRSEVCDLFQMKPRHRMM